MKVLITGGFGFIGSRLTRILKDAGIDVTPFGSTTLSAGLIQDQNYSFFKPFDIIFHLAAIPRIGLSLEKPNVVLSNNYNSTNWLCHILKEFPEKKLIFASSSSVKFADLTQNPYALSKKFGEDLIELHRETFGLRATSVRFFNVYGPGERNGGKHTTLIKAFKDRVQNKQNLLVNGDGIISRDYTHVDDVVSGLVRVWMEMQRGDEKPMYEIGSGCPISVLQIAQAFQEGTDLQIEFGPDRQGDAPITYADPAYLPVGWYPTIDVLDYIRDWKVRGCPKD